jgi:catechol 2,3-dioxygenase-like lactoylglutathione lyase family enzyme
MFNFKANHHFNECAMQPDLRLGYLVFDVRRPARWASFCKQMLGLPAPLTHGDGSLGWQLDDACQRLMVREGPADDLGAIGLQCADDAALDARLRRLQQAGAAVTAAPPELLRARRVQRALGLGHVVLVSHDVPAMEAFYTGALGFGVTERLAARVGPIDFRGVFLHCNARHHSLALFDLPLRRRVHHFMLQASRLADIGLAYERARRHKVPLSLGLGQHPDPDGTFSFYGATPSGFDFEIGAGSQTIDPSGWQAQATGITSTWGHEPKLRVKLQMAAGLLASKVSGPRHTAKAPV